MDVDRSVASATARSSGNFDRADANGYQVSSRAERQAGQRRKIVQELVQGVRAVAEP